MHSLQAKKWKRMQRVLKQSPFYKNMVQAETPFSAYPVMNKALHMGNFDSINTVGLKRDIAQEVAVKAENSRDFSPTINNVTVGLSSGTSGNRGIFIASEIERAHWVAAVLDKVLGFSFKKRSIAFFLRANSNLYESVKSKLLRFEFFDLMKDLDEHIERLNKLNPNILVAQPSMLLELANRVKLGNLSISPDKIVSVAEVLYPEDKKILESVFGQTIHQVYQCTEGFLASTCEYGTLHFHEDFLIIEKKYLDDEKLRFHPIITDLERSSQPFIRYELNDIVHEKRNCACKSKMTGIEKIEGRSDDMLEFMATNGQPVKIFPDFFRRAIILASDGINDYCLIQTSTDNLSLYTSGSNTEFEAAKIQIQQLLKTYKVERIAINRIFTNELIKGNKLRRIRNANR
ncbi:MAG TPA: F390 synthetase-related protein [Flavobacteriales bacterium]|nr:F390 synthetase-related protein [Flavobacteriales bacterium]